MPTSTKGKTRLQVEIETREKETVCLRVVREGGTYGEAARQAGYETEAGARHAVRRALARFQEPDVEVLRTIEAAKLRDLARRVMAELERDHVVVQWGKVVLNPADGQPLHDSSAVIACLRELRMISERYSRLRGLDAPLRTVVEEITEDAVQAEVKRITALADALEAELAEDVKRHKT